MLFFRFLFPLYRHLYFGKYILITRGLLLDLYFQRGRENPRNCRILLGLWPHEVAALYAVLRCTLPRKTLSSVAARRTWKGKQLQRQVHQAMWRTILLPLLKGPTHLELRNYVFLSWELLWKSDSFSCFKVSNTGRRDSKSLLGFDCVHNWAFCGFSCSFLTFLTFLLSQSTFCCCNFWGFEDPSLWPYYHGCSFALRSDNQWKKLEHFHVLFTIFITSHILMTGIHWIFLCGHGCSWLSV